LVAWWLGVRHRQWSGGLVSDTGNGLGGLMAWCQTPAWSGGLVSDNGNGLVGLVSDTSNGLMVWWLGGLVSDTGNGLVVWWSGFRHRQWSGGLVAWCQAPAMV
jgi:hypothetical protein